VNALRLESSRDGGHLELRHRGPEWWEVTLTLPGLTATAKVDCFSYDGEHTLGVLFRRLSDDWRGWDGERTWASIEGGVDLAATHDGLGHVALRVRIRSRLYDDDWTANGVIWLDAGQLGRVAREVAAFETSP
jgi:hypothetical protein